MALLVVVEEHGHGSKKRDRMMRKKRSGGFGFRFDVGVDCIVCVSV